MIIVEAPVWVALVVVAVGVVAAVAAGMWLGRRSLRDRHRAELAAERREVRFAAGRAARVSVAQYAAEAGIVPAPATGQVEQDAAAVLAAVSDQREPEPMHGDGEIPEQQALQVGFRHTWPVSAPPAPPWRQPVGWSR